MILRCTLITLTACFAVLTAGCGSAKNQAASGSQKSSVVKNAPWKKFSPKGEEFSLLMPGVPTETTDASDLDSTVIAQQSFMLKALQGSYKAGYLISYADFAPEKRGILSYDELSEKMWKDTYGDLGPRLIYKKKFILGKMRGIEYQYTGANSASHLVTARDFWVENRLYQTSAIMPKEQFGKGDAIRYLDSFELTD